MGGGLSRESTCMTQLFGRGSARCGKPAVLRRGVRCEGGCLGEGEFEYACANHAEWISNFAGGRCASCRSRVRLFPPQAMEVAS